jgi:hypothetical protein
MAYLMTHFWPGGTEAQYRAMTAVIHPADGLPAGQLQHAAGTSDGGFLISVVWDSKDSADAFVSGTLMPAMPVAGGFEGRPEERTAEVVS